MRIGCLVVLWLGVAGVVMAQTPEGGARTIQLGAPVASVAMAGWSNRAAVVTADNKLTVWELAEGRQLRTMTVPTSHFDNVTISDDGKWVFAGDHEGHAWIWNAATGQVQREWKLPHYPSAASFSHDGTRMAVAPMGEPVEVYDVAAAKLLYRTAGVMGGTAALAFARDGSRLATADADTEVRIYDARDGKLLAENRDFLLEPLAVDFSADGHQVIAAGGDKVLSFIDAKTGKMTWHSKKKDEPFAALKVSPDGVLVGAMLMKAENMLEPAPVVQWNASTGEEKGSWTPPALPSACDWMGDGKIMCASAAGDTVRFWRVP